MSYLMGAPAGIIESEQMDRENLAGQMGAMKTMGEIASMPGERALRSAQAANQGAEASTKLEALARQRMMDDLSRKFVQQDKEPEPTSGQKALADPQMQMLAKGARWADYLSKNGASMSQVEEVSQKLATQASNLAVAHEKEGQALKDKADTQAKHLDAMGSLAGAMKAHPELYADLLMKAKEQGVDTSQFPPTYQAPLIDAIQQQALTAKDQLELGSKAKRDVLADKKVMAELVKDKAATENLNARTKALEETGSATGKVSGPGSPATKAYTEARTELAKQRKELDYTKNFPPLPKDESLIDAAARKRTLPTFLGPGGVEIIYLGRDAEGIQRFDRYDAYKAKEKLKKREALINEPVTAE